MTLDKGKTEWKEATEEVLEIARTRHLLVGLGFPG